MKELSRRTLLQGSSCVLPAVLGLSSLIDFDVYADGCERKDAKADNETIKMPEGQVLTWVDGPLADMRANLTLLYLKPQTPGSMLERVVLTDKSGETIGIRYFANETMGSLPPFIIFSNISFARSLRYFLLFQIRDRGTSKVLRLTLDQSNFRLSLPLLYPKKTLCQQPAFSVPLHVMNELPCFVDSDEKNATLCLRDGVLQVSLQTLATDFTVHVTWWRTPQMPGEHPGQVVMTDPVGRLLALSYLMPLSDARLETQVLKPLTTLLIQQLQLVADQLPKLKDCPFVRIFVFDGKNLIHSNLSLV